MRPRHQVLAPLGMLVSAACWGIMWYPYRLMQEAGVSGVASSFYTYSITAVLGLLIFSRDWRSLFKVPQSIFWLMLVAGWTNLSYVLAVIEGEVMRIMLLFYLSPLWTLLLAHFWLKERISLQQVAVITISLTGAFIMLWQSGSMPLPVNQSEWLALSAGLGFACTNVITRKSTHLSLGSKSMAVWLGVVMMCVLFMFLHGLPPPNPAIFTLHNWLVMGVISCMLIASTVFVQYGITHIPVTRASVIFLFELVVAAVASYYLAHEVMQLHEWIGGSLIMAAALFAATLEDKHA